MQVIEKVTFSNLQEELKFFVVGHHRLHEGNFHGRRNETIARSSEGKATNTNGKVGLGTVLGRLRAVLRPSWGSLFAVMGRLGAVLGHFGLSWVVLGPSWGHLGSSWGRLGPSWGHLGLRPEKV